MPTSPQPNLTEAELDELERLEREATSVPWKWEMRRSGRTWIMKSPEGAIFDDGSAHGEYSSEISNSSDPYFIAALRNAAPRLIAAARELESLKREYEHYRRVTEIELDTVNRVVFERNGEIAALKTGLMVANKKIDLLQRQFAAHEPHKGIAPPHADDAVEREMDEPGFE